ncbi:MAG: hypothetical protein ABI181_07335 [Mycobacteriaceae bacterium]
MRGGWRWLVVLVGLALLVSTPPVIARWPVPASDDGATRLLARVQASIDTPYSGYAQSVGGVVLPATSALGGLPDLLGGTTTLRAWYRGPADWRVDTIQLAGERDLYRSASGMWSWDYEANTAVLTPLPEPSLRLPRAGDLLPTTLGHRLLSEARPEEVTRLPTRRVAGRDAPGLRVVPAERQSTVREVDVWVDPGTGLPLRVDVLGAGSARPVVSTAFLDFSAATPDAATTRFTPPPGSNVQQRAGTDIASFADRIDAVALPASIDGLPRKRRGLGGSAGGSTAGSVGVYGRGVTILVAAPLPRRAAASLLDQLRRSPGAEVDDTGVALAVGPLSLRVTTPVGDGRSYLLAGTVTPDTLTSAAQLLTTGAR